MEQLAFPLVASSLLTARAWRRKSLTPTGCMAAWTIGFVAAYAGVLHFVILLTFFMSSTFVTKLGAARKAKLDPHYAATGNRNVWQVLCNGGCSTVVLALACVGVLPSTPNLHYAVLAHYCCCQGDTWSSELGVLSKTPPRLIIGWRRVPAGTNGGVSLMGFLGALLGGALMAATVMITYYYTSERPIGLSYLGLLTVALSSSLLGSAMDSVIGQFLQESWFDMEDRVVEPDDSKRKKLVSGVNLLSNNAVNFLTACLVTAGFFVCGSFGL